MALCLYECMWLGLAGGFHFPFNLTIHHHPHPSQSEAWDVLGELEFRHRGLIGPQALWQDMQAHPKVAHHILNWLLDKYVAIHRL